MLASRGDLCAKVCAVGVGDHGRGDTGKPSGYARSGLGDRKNPFVFCTCVARFDSEADALLGQVDQDALTIIDHFEGAGHQFGRREYPRSPRLLVTEYARDVVADLFEYTTSRLDSETVRAILMVFNAQVDVHG
tara:strand:+ start:82 stop:483 length:402 start_codon:yes stop_codon:yes gene_type:complete